jgi:hypothetical protein
MPNTPKRTSSVLVNQIDEVDIEALRALANALLADHKGTYYDRIHAVLAHIVQLEVVIVDD